MGLDTSYCVWLPHKTSSGPFQSALSGSDGTQWFRQPLMLNAPSTFSKFYVFCSYQHSKCSHFRRLLFSVRRLLWKVRTTLTSRLMLLDMRKVHQMCCCLRWIFEPTSANSWWPHASVHTFSLSVCMSLDQNYWKKFISREPFDLGWPNMVWWWMLMKSRSCVKVAMSIKKWYSKTLHRVFHIWPNIQWSRFKIKGQGHYVKKHVFKYFA